MPALVRPLVAALCLAGLVACVKHGQPVYNVENAAYGLSAAGQPRNLNMRQIEQAIVKAGANRGWVMERQSVGHVVGGLVVRGKHSATVDIYYDREAFSIVRKETQGLEYDPAADTIHKAYNKWVRILEQEIREEIQIARTT